MIFKIITFKTLGSEGLLTPTPRKRWGTKEVSPTPRASFLPWGSFQAVMQKGEIQVEPNGLHELERQLGRPKHLKCQNRAPRRKVLLGEETPLGAHRHVHRSECVENP